MHVQSRIYLAENLLAKFESHKSWRLVLLRRKSDCGVWKKLRRNLFVQVEMGEYLSRPSVKKYILYDTE